MLTTDSAECPKWQMDINFYVGGAASIWEHILGFIMKKRDLEESDTHRKYWRQEENAKKPT